MSVIPVIPKGGRVLLHACCGPCSLMPVIRLKEEGFAVTAFFFNPNIHPREEYDLRRRAMAEAAGRLDIPVLFDPESDGSAAADPAAWVRNLDGVTREGERCAGCYRIRLERAARAAAEGGFAAFSSSLLYSRYQRHDVIREEGARAARQAGKPFLYRDFRPDWQQGIELSKEFGLYRQKWCGCILSKGEAEAQRAARQAAKAEKTAQQTGKSQ